MIRTAAAAFFCLLASAAFAADKPDFRPPEAWVNVAPDPVPEATEQGPAIQFVLNDDQTYFAADGDHFYVRRVAKVLAPEGLSKLGTMQWTWDPSTESIAIHALKIIRDGTAIDLLADRSKVTVLRRETNLERAMLDGRLTATREVEGLRVGDVVDASWTLTRNDPAVKGHSELVDGLTQFTTDHVLIREMWDASKPMRWRVTEGLSEPTVTDSAGRKQFLFDLKDAQSPTPPVQAPLRFARLGLIELTQFSSWSEVSSLMWPLYQKAATLDQNSPLKAEIAKIRAANSDQKAEAEAALKLVQDYVRYQFVGLNDGGLVPAGADETWQRRFGDCKGKTVLLLALLNAMDIPAEPVLVSANSGDGMDERLPMVSHFNHVLLRATIGGKVYWLDGTRPSDPRGLDALEPPPFRWGLPVKPEGSELVKIDQPPLREPSLAAMLRYDASAGFDKPAPARIEMDFHGDIAPIMSRAAEQQSHDQNERQLRQLVSTQFPWIVFKSVDWSYDNANGTFKVMFDGDATLDWRRNRDVSAREFRLAGSDSDPKGFALRESGPFQQAPYAIPYPIYLETRTELVLPDHGRGFTLTGNDFEKTVGQFEVVRRGKIENGTAELVSSTRSLAPEFPASEVGEMNNFARDIGDDPVFVRAPKGEAMQ